MDAIVYRRWLLVRDPKVAPLPSDHLDVPANYEEVDGLRPAVLARKHGEKSSDRGTPVTVATKEVTPREVLIDVLTRENLLFEGWLEHAGPETDTDTGTQ